MWIHVVVSHMNGGTHNMEGFCWLRRCNNAILKAHTRWTHCHSEWSVGKLTPHRWNNMMLDVKKAIAGNSCTEWWQLLQYQVGEQTFVEKMYPFGTSWFYQDICKTVWSLFVSSQTVVKEILFWNPLVLNHGKHIVFKRCLATTQPLQMDGSLKSI